MSKKLLPARPEMEFISYTGRYPTLCSGALTIRVGDEYYHLDHILRSGGSIHDPVTGDYDAVEGDWFINTEDLPEELQPFVDDITALVNENVEHGCCGGCI